MNTLSWLLYLAGVSSGLSAFFAASATFMVFIGGFVCLIVAAHNEKTPPKKLLAIPIAGFIFAIIACFIPSKETIMYIAASEYGEKVVNSKEVRDLANPATELLKIWMKKETERLTKEIK